MRNLPSPADRFPEDSNADIVRIRRAEPPLRGYDMAAERSGIVDVGQDDEDLAVTLQRYLQIFLKHKWLILAVTMLFAALGGLYGLTRTPLYLSTATIQIDLEAKAVIDGAVPVSDGGNTRSADFQRTHYELLRSRAMAERVVSSVGLHEDEDFLKPLGWSLLGWIFSGFGAGGGAGEAAASERVSAARGILLQNLEVRPLTGSRLVHLSFKDPDPKRAQRIANAYADAYVASNLDKRFEATSYAKIFLENQITQLKLRLEESEKALIDFAEREKIVQTKDRASIAENNLAAANAALGELISERIRTEQTWRQVADTTALDLPQLLSNSVIDGLRAEKKTLERQYEEKLETFKPSYPEMVQISNKIKEVERQLASEVATVKASLKGAFEFSRNQERDMKAQIEDLRAEVLDLQKKSIRYNILQREAETNRGLYNSVLQRYKEVDVASGGVTNNIFIVDRALASSSPSEPRMMRLLMMFCVLGLALGLGAAYVVEIFDDVIRSPDALEEITGLPMIGMIPYVSSEQELAKAFDDPRSEVSEAYRSLGTALQFSTETGLPRSIVVTSAGVGEGKSSTALAISKQFAMLGLKVLLVDADLRRPSLHTRLRRENTIGLSNFLAGAVSASELVQQTDIKSLKFIASGPVPPNAGDLLAGTRIFSLVSVGLEMFDLIVFDAPPMLGLADAQLLAGAVSSTVFVASARQSRKGAVLSALRRLRVARIRPLGVVLTKFDRQAAGYGYSQQYGYGSDHYSYGPSVAEVDDRAHKPGFAALSAE